MKRLTVVLPILVLAGLLMGFLAERWGGPGGELPSFTPAQPPRFDSLVAPGGRAALGGRVLAPSGEPVPDASLYLRSDGAPFWTFTDEQGHFELLGLAEEPTDAVVLAWGFPPTSFAVLPGPEPVELELPPHPAPPPKLPGVERADLAGTVRGAGAVWSDPAGYEVVFSPVLPPEVLQGPVERRARTDAAGTFALEGLALGDYDVHVLPSWARGGTWPTLAAEWTAKLEHRGPDGLELELELEAGAVEGRLWDPSRQPIEGALVLLADADDPRRVWPPAATDAEGRFRIRALPPGRYVLAARAGEGVLEVEVRVKAGEVSRPDLPALRTREGS
jgi:hypothetical protein